MTIVADFVRAFAPRQRMAGPVNPQATAEFFAPLRLKQEDFNDPYKQHAWIRACIEAKAGAISSVPWLIREGERENSDIVKSHAWTRLFERPNPAMQTRAQFWKSSLIHLERDGGTIWVKEGAGDGRIGRGVVPSELWPISHRYFEPVVEKPGSIRVLRWLYTSPSTGERIFYEPHEVVTIRHADPDNPLFPLSPLSAAMSAARQDYKASLWNEAFFDNDATAGVVLVSQRPITDDKARRELLKAWNDRHKGSSKAFRTGLLEGGITAQTLGTSHKDMAFLEQKRWSREEIMAVYRVPKFVLALYEDLNFSTQRGAITSWWNDSLDPLMVLIEDSAWPQLFRDVEGGKFFGQFDRESIAVLHEQFGEKLDNGLKLQQFGYPTNWIADKLDFGMRKLPAEIGDQPLLPSNLIPADQIFLPEDEAEIEKPPPEEDEEDEQEEEKEEEEEDEKEETASDSSARDESVAVIRAKVVTFLSRQSPKRAAALRALHRSVLPWEARFRQRFRRYLMELRSEQLKLVGELEIPRFGIVEKTRAVAADQVLFDLDAWGKRSKAMHHPLYVGIVENGIDFTVKETGLDFSEFDAADPKVIDIVSRREVKLAESNVSMRNRVRRSIEEGVKNKESIGQIQDRIKADFNSFSAHRSLRIARTEVMGATNQARFATMGEEGIEEHTWTTAGDEVVRESHAAQDGVTVRMGTPFPNGLRFPGDPDATDPGEVANCRCATMAKL